jgi:ABC-type multidrug transport system ATPase subunit
VINVLKIFGIYGCKDTYVGDDMIRGISGGQKRRVTSAEMIVNPRPLKLMDSISNGLDSATTFDIIRSFRDIFHTLNASGIVSLLQVVK